MSCQPTTSINCQSAFDAIVSDIILTGSN
uniref:Uncharacterized protein tmp_locus_26 n=1 Tax=Homo sapiens TaxID=9606 RepID=Q4ZG13_HUMAN|nr:unknown [Homo sapiens]